MLLTGPVGYQTRIQGKLWKFLSVRVNCAYCYALDPNVEQRILLAMHVGAAHFADNWGLSRSGTPGDPKIA